MKKYPSMSYPTGTSGLCGDGSVYVQEKVDGANGRVTLERNMDEEYQTPNRRIVFGSRNMQFKNMDDESNTFSDTFAYVRENIDVPRLKEYDSTYDGIVLYGEYMIPHTIREGYNWDKWENKFIGFDVWSIGEREFLSPEVSQNLFQDVNIPFVDILESYTGQEWENGETRFHTEDQEWPEDDSWCPWSRFGDGRAEGIVIKNHATQTYAKMVREDFRETQSTSSMEGDSDAVKLSYQYIPDARIKKTVHKLIDEGEWSSLEMGMMQELPKSVIRDMINEEGYNIVISEDWNIDLAQFRSVTNDRCSEVLRDMINSRSDE